MIAEMKASGFAAKHLPEGITALRDREHSKDIMVPLVGGFRGCNL